MLVGKKIHEMLCEAHIPIDTAQHDVPIGGDHFVVFAVDMHYRHVERTATEVVNQYGLLSLGLTLVVQKTFGNSKRDCGGGWFIDNGQNLQPRKLASVLCRTSSRFVEIRRDGDYRFADRTDFFLGVSPKLFKNQRLNDFGRIRLAINDLGIGGLTYFALCVLSHAFRHQTRGLYSLASNNNFVVLKKHDAGRGEVALSIEKRFWSPSGIKMCNDAEGGSQVNANDIRFNSGQRSSPDRGLCSLSRPRLYQGPSACNAGLGSSRASRLGA